MTPSSNSHLANLGLASIVAKVVKNTNTNSLIIIFQC
eukprot:05562.XXX_293787_293894_1 [CDS] Oithona nana genome sequencing.